MKVLLLFTLLFITSCATKYIVPGNRFLTPETQGGALRGQFEFQQTSANQLTIDTSEGTVNKGVKYDKISRSALLLSESLFEPFDIFWSHTVSANSMLGGKFQILGGPRLSNSTGHKLSVAAAFGGNEHDTDNDKVEFRLSGQELLLLYGFRFSPNLLTYSSFSYATYDFKGKIFSKVPSLNGAKPKFETQINSLSGGVELSYEFILAKLEATYQQLETTKTKDKSNLIIGYSLGFSW